MKTKAKTKAITTTKTNWTLDPTHSELMFEVKQLVISTVTGRFKKFNVAVEMGGEDLTSLLSCRLTADLRFIDTNNERRDDHLRSNDFFNADKFKQLVFESTRYEGDSAVGKLYGDLTIRDITQSIELQIEAGGIRIDPYGQIRVRFIVNGKIDRKDFGLMWNAVTEAGGVLVGDEVKIHAEIQMVRKL